LSIKWDQAREEVRLEDHEVLREKVSLQQELIRKQDEYAESKRQQQKKADDEVRICVIRHLDFILERKLG
jgi:hypothetical protein